MHAFQSVIHSFLKFLASLQFPFELMGHYCLIHIDTLLFLALADLGYLSKRKAVQNFPFARFYLWQVVPQIVVNLGFVMIVLLYLLQ